jgi:hypothetical protein
MNILSLKIKQANTNETNKRDTQHTRKHKAEHKNRSLKNTTLRNVCRKTTNSLSFSLTPWTKLYRAVHFEGHSCRSLALAPLT